MKKINLLILLIFSAALSGVYAQCSQCTPVNCSAIKPTGGLCNTLHDDTAGKPYEEVISFYMPKKLTDPATLALCQCSDVNLRRIDVVGVQGLPPGMSYTISQNGGYDVAGGDSLGCVHFCGTPIAPGTYILIVNLLADVTANGTPIGSVSLDDQAQSYRDTFTIFPGTSACPNTFSLGGGSCVTKACDSVNVNLSANLDNPYCANLISYDWSYGNGSTSHIKNPGAINYNVPDTFPLSLTTTYYTYRIKSVYVECKGGWAGDIEEATTLQNPEPFIKINALGFDNKANYANNTKTATFNNLNLVIPYTNCATPVDIEVWDLDESIAPTISPSDLLSTHTITPSVPNQVSSLQGNSNISVTFDTVASSSVTETIDIVVFPHPPVPEVTFASDSICGGDSTLITANPPLTGYLYTWYFNDTTEILVSDASFYVKQAGNYKVKITNSETGCAETSANVTLNVGQAPPSNINVIFNGTSAFVSPFPSSGFSVDWYYNGNLVVGQNGKFLPFLGNGDYQAELYNTAFPFCRTVSSVKNIVSGIEELADNSVHGLTVYPNPNSGMFNLKFASDEAQDIAIRVQNTVGQLVSEKKIENFAGDFNEEMNFTDLGKGIYFVTLETAKGRLNTKVVVQ